ncbi:S-adenosyl-L-methionine-dependent methyltransferase [Cytidiella melzeri]|nr:S-adenosyl-L-methionine-dependent methyltransferase [Cytidiella melzeri]
MWCTTNHEIVSFKLPFVQCTCKSGSTVNEDEIAHFSRLSSLWWDEQGEFAQLHKMNPTRVRFMREKLVESAFEDDINSDVDIGKVLRGKTVLDVGCGGGVLSESLARLGGVTLGIDASSSNIRIASTHAAADPSLRPSNERRAGGLGGSLEYKHISAEELLRARGPNSFDVVCSMEVIEHVDNPRGFLDSCAQLVKPGGHLFLSTIARTPLAYFLTIFMAEDMLRLVAPGTHTYSKYINPQELEGFFRSYKSSPMARTWITGIGPMPRVQAETRGMIYTPWNGEWLLAGRGSKWAEGCNYLFWVRKPLESG